MPPEYSRQGRSLLFTVTVIALALQALKLGSRGLLLKQWPTGGQWGQLALVLWLLISLWEGKNWARVASALYYSLATVAGVAVLVLMWSKSQPSLRIVSIIIVVLAAVVSCVLWFSAALRWHMAERLAAER